MFRNDLERFLSSEPISSEFGLLCFFSFLFILRVQSECLPLRRARLIDPLLSKVKQNEKALIGLRTFNDETRLVLKLSTRKNTRYGSIMMRPCFCHSDSFVPASLCPIHRVWPLIRQRVEPGAMIFPSLQGNNLNRILKQALFNSQFPDSRLYTMYCFRRGALMELKRSKSTLGVIMKTAGWAAASFRSYLALQEDEERVIKSLLRNIDTGIESDESLSEGSAG